ncbi:MAG: signal peptide protein [Prosthecobacter sp.]|nr:signal peptide protein [Prosthecobacter sp.]
MAGTVGGNSAVQTAKGAGTGARRFVAVGNLLGFQTKQLFPTTQGREYEKTTLLEPLWENRSQMTVLRGLDHGVKGGHFAVHSFLSGVLNSEAQNRPDGNVTIDQYLADEIGFETRFPSLTVGSEGGIHGGCQIAWTKSGVRVPPVTNPSQLFEKLFVSDSKERQARRVQENQVQSSILDSVMGEAKNLSKRINKEDKDKLDEYLTSVRDVEKRLELRERWVSQPKPKAPFDKPANHNAVEDLPILYELIALALQTDSTRIATLEIGGDFMPQHLGIKKDWHGLSHHGNDPEAIANLIALERYQIEHFGKFITRLSKMNDGDRTLLDSTTAIFGSGMGDGNSHKNSDLPIILAGGGYKHGEFREVPREGINKVPLCNLFVDIAQKMGVETDSFGNSTGRFA